MKETSSSASALDYMQKFHDRESNYFQTKSNQREARQGFVELYNLDQKKGEDIWNHTFPKFLRKNRLKKEDFLKTRFQKAKNSDINATIKPEPQGPTIEKNFVEINGNPMYTQFSVRYVLNAGNHIMPSDSFSSLVKLSSGNHNFRSVHSPSNADATAVASMYSFLICSWDGCGFCSMISSFIISTEFFSIIGP